MPEDLQTRLAALETLLTYFKPERVAHLVLSSASFLTLLTAAALIIARGAQIGELTVIFGSTGLIAYSSGRLLHMWNQAFRVIYDDRNK